MPIVRRAVSFVMSLSFVAVFASFGATLRSIYNLDNHEVLVKEKRKEEQSKEEEATKEKMRQKEERMEEEQEQDRKRKAEEKKKTQHLNTSPPILSPIYFPQFRVDMSRQRLGAQTRELERLNRSLKLRQRELDSMQRENARRRQQQMQRPQAMERKVDAPEVRYEISLEEEERREEKKRRKQERVKQSFEGLRRRQEREMDQGGLLRTAFFP